MVGIFLHPVFLVPAALFTAWMVLVIFVGSQLGVWDWAQLKDTLYWVVPGFILMFGAVNAATEPGFFRHRVRDAIAYSVFLGFYLGLVTLDLRWELVLVPVLTILALVSTFGGVTLGGSTAVSKQAGNRAALIAGFIVIALLIYTTVGLVQNAGATNWLDLARGLALLVWLTLGALPSIWAMSVLFVYENALSHMRIATTEGRLPWKSVLALIVSFRFRRSALHRFAGPWPRRLVMAKGFREARAVIAEQQTEARLEDETRKASMSVDDSMPEEGTTDG